MKRLAGILSGRGVVCWMLLGASTPLLALPIDADTTYSQVKIYAVGADVSAPELLPGTPIPVATEKCKGKLDGKAVLSLIVNASGVPRNVMFIHPTGTDIDKLAVLVVSADRFKPGMTQGAPVAVGRSVEVGVKGCITDGTDSPYRKIVRLREQPTQKFGELKNGPSEIGIRLADSAEPKGDGPKLMRVGNGVSPPTALLQPDTSYSDEARQKRINGTCVLSLIVDAHGLPQKAHITRALGYGLDANALASVEGWRFRPAMHEGAPVPVQISVEVRFQLFIGGNGQQ